jgi:hypothetical protein
LAPLSTVFSTPHPPRYVVNISESREHRHLREDFNPSTFELVRENPGYNLVISRAIASNRYGGRACAWWGDGRTLMGARFGLYCRGVSAPCPDQFACSYCQGLSSLYLLSNRIVIYVLCFGDMHHQLCAVVTTAMSSRSTQTFPRLLHVGELHFCDAHPASNHRSEQVLLYDTRRCMP